MKSHRFDAISFASGVVFTALGLIFLLPKDASDVWSFLGDVGSWFWPTVLLAIGFGILASVLLPDRSKKEDPHSEEMI